MAAGVPGGVVVVGAGAAGVAACAELRALGWDGRLTLIGAEHELPYERPPLSKGVLLGRAAVDDLALRPGAWYAEHGIRLRLGERVSAIRPAEGRVVLADGTTEAADAVVLATGGEPRRLAVPGAGHPAVTVLRTARDAASLRERLLPGATVGVIGAGLIGAEVAASAVTLGCDVVLIDPAPRPLEHAVGPQVAELLHGQHRAHGVRVLRAAVREVADRGKGVRLLLDGGAESVDCDAVVVGVGLTRDLALAEDAGLAVDAGVLVDERQRTSNPRVFAVGDLARQLGPQGPRPPAEHWDGALTGARAAAAALLGRAAPRPRAPWFWSDRYDTRLEVAGEIAGADQFVVRGVLGEREYSLFALRQGRCAGAVGVNRPSDVGAARRLIERRTPVDADLLADESADLRALARG
ncbi:FAD-dependent oxidoreductase [Kitasatospora sp. NPDC005856]|uniref:NAD(P)/FAD-dependent oxidoreductase n=1 Tax=Kitasatospora sp. NPDC005856 TaxID=3154566 RepID=UPI0033E882F0